MSKKNRKNNLGRFGPHQKAGSSSNLVRKNHEPILIEFSRISSEAQLRVSEFLKVENISGSILGVIKAFDGTYNPVIHSEDYKNPILVKKLPNIFANDLEISEYLSRNKNSYSNLEVLELNSATSADFLVLKRTYSLNTLQDALSSSIKISLSEVLLTLYEALKITIEAHENNFIHGHIHPGNICFKTNLSGSILDAELLSTTIKTGFLKSPVIEILAPEVLAGASSKASDVYGFAATLRAILECPTISRKDNEPSSEETLAVFGPIIEAALHENEDERISLKSFSSIFFDFIPMFFTEEEREKLNLNVAQISEISGEIGSLQEIDLSKNASFSTLPTENNQDIRQNEEEVEKISEDVNPETNVDSLFDSAASEFFENSEPRVNESSVDINDKRFSFGLGEEKQSKTSNNYGLAAKTLRLIILIALISLIIFLGSKVLSNLGIIGERVDIGQHTDEFTGSILDYENLSSAWASGVPSQMKLVADQAVYRNVGRVLAERVILGSITNNEVKSNLVDTSILRVAFSPKWEESLNEDDRRYALSLGLIQILKNQIPRDLGKIEDRNPAIILALMSSGSSNISKFLEGVPVSILENLPVPYGPAFQLISTGKNTKTCGDLDVLTLARLGTRGVESPLVVSQFLAEDYKRRMSALAILFSSQPENARKVLDIAIAHPNFSLNKPEIMWAKKVALLDWEDLDPSDELFLLAGVPLRGNHSISAQSVAKLFLHPSAKVRGYAAGMALEKISFQHKGAPEILNMVKDAPDILTQDQFVMLGQILEDPKRTAETHRKVVQGFIASNPPIEIAKHLLLESASEKEATVLDTALGIYLGDKGWIPAESEIGILINHPDKVARMLAYQTVFTTMQGKSAIGLLKTALGNESDPEFKTQLKAMISKMVKSESSNTGVGE